MHGNKPNIKHLHVFQSICYVLQDRENLDKFELKSDLEIFIRYSYNNRAYRVYNLRSSNLVESINFFIDYSGDTKMVKYEDSDVFEIWDSNKNVVSDGDLLSTANPPKPPKNTEDEEK